MVVQMFHQYLLFDLQFWSQNFLSALQAHEADDDSMTSHLEDSKREMDKLRDEINQIKKMINSKTKETNKLRTQLEKISKERDQAQAKIGKKSRTSMVQVNTYFRYIFAWNIELELI